METRKPFPQEEEAFADDARISYAASSRKYVATDENGEEWEWNPRIKKWFQSTDEELEQQQAEIYKIPGVDETVPALNPAQKRKDAQLEHPTAKKAKATAAAPPRRNTAVFVSGLPLDVDVDEVRDAFARFGGVISESIDTDEKRIKLYKDKDGNFKGEALVIYHYPASVQNAITLLDEAMFPRKYNDAESTRIRVTAADSSYKAHQGDDTVAEDRPAPQRRSGADRAKAKKKNEEMERRTGEWSSDEEVATNKQTSSRWEKVVVMKNVFTFQTLKEEPTFIEEIAPQMKASAEKTFGEVKNITFFDQEEDGIVTMRFNTAQAAKACMTAYNGKPFEGRRIEAYLANGQEKFKKTRKGHNNNNNNNDNAEDDEAKRIEDFSKFIEGDTSAE